MPEKVRPSPDVQRWAAKAMPSANGPVKDDCNDRSRARTVSRIRRGRRHHRRGGRGGGEVSFFCGSSVAMKRAEALGREGDLCALSPSRNNHGAAVDTQLELFPVEVPPLGGGCLLAATLMPRKVENWDAYPFGIPCVRHLETLEFHRAVTFLVGENGSGKSTLLEALALRLA